MASDFIPPSSFLNPLGPIQWGLRHELEGAKIVAAKAEELRDAARAGATKAVKDAVVSGAMTAAGIGPFSPLGFLVGNPLDHLPDLPSLPDTVPDVNDLAKKALIAEVVLVGGVVAIAAIAAWYFSRSPEARKVAGTAVLTGGKFLLTRGG